MNAPSHRIALSTLTVAGFKFGFERASQFGQWAPVTVPVDGDGNDLAIEVDADGNGGFFRAHAVPVHP